MIGISQNKDISHFSQVFQFLDEIGIQYKIVNEVGESFLQGIRINKGVINIHPERIIAVGDILHEAGHIACIPGDKRVMVEDDIQSSIGEEYAYELAVIMWTVAAAHHLDIPLNKIFHDQGYKGDSDWLIEEISSGNYIGLPLLQWLGLAH